MPKEKEPTQVKVRPPEARHEIAVVENGVVQRILITQDGFAALLQSDPFVANSTGVDVVVGQTTYNPDTKEFTHPDGQVQKAVPGTLTAFIYEGVVEDNLDTHDQEFADLLERQPIFVNCTKTELRVGQATHNPETGEFTNPDGTVWTAIPVVTA